MNRFKVINEVFNQKLSQIFSVNSVYDERFQTEIEPNVPFMSKKSMQPFVKTFSENRQVRCHGEAVMRRKQD